MIQAQLADGRVLEFPDNTPPDVIQNTVKRLVGNSTVAGSNILSPKAQQLPPQQQEQLLQAREQQLSVIPEQQRPEGPSAPSRRAQSFEELKAQNPALAELIEGLSPLDAAAIGFQQGLRTVARGAGKIVGADAFADVNDPGLTALQDASGAAQVGKIIGEAAPFAAVAPITGTVGTGLQATRGGTQIVPQITSTAGRAATTGGLGAAEGASIAAGEDRSSGEVAATALLGGAVGAGAEVLPALRRGSSKQLPIDLINEGEALIKKTPRSSDVKRAIDEATPTIEQLRGVSRQIFDEVDNAGITIKPNIYRGLLRRIRSQTERNGLDAVNTPQASRAIQRLEELADGDATFRSLDQIRETAQVAAGNLQNRKEAALGSQIIDSIDQFLNTVDSNLVQGGNVGNRVKVARELWGRARRSEMIDQAVDRAKEQASGFENGIRIQFRQILNNQKKRKFFNSDEIEAMQRVVRGTPAANLYKFLGRMAPNEGQATNFLGASIGVGGGAGAGSLIGGPGGAAVGAVVLPAIGKVSRDLSQRLTRDNAKLANKVIRAGRDADKIARAYLTSTPKAQRSPEELAQLLMRQDVMLEDATSDIAIEAAQIAQKLRQQQAAATAAAVTAVPSLTRDNE